MMNSLSYPAALEYLYSFVDYSLKHISQWSQAHFDLGRMVDLAAAAGNPQQEYPILHVAGTKGKGSVSALCASALQHAGYQTGLYTSPHLFDFNERYQVNGKFISHHDLAAMVTEIQPLVAKIPALTTFEIATVIAFAYFSRQGVNAAVIEVGLGGRLDATNIVQPLVSVITSISYDHTQILGNTLAQIAGEKAGIIKPGVPVVISPQKEEARQVIESVAVQNASRLVQVEREYQVSALERSLDGQTFLIESASGSATELSLGKLELTIPLLGRHQIENAVTAYAALQVARQQGLKIDESAITAGFRNVHWPGRFEILRREPPLVVDCAHNRDAAMKLRQTLDDYLPGRPVIMVFGASEDKDIEGMLMELAPRLSQVIMVKSFHPRAADADALVVLAGNLGIPAQAVPDVAHALQVAEDLAGPQGIVLVTGSIFVVAEARTAYLGIGEVDETT
jgi:dihydrofolate synthase/folylpolyglutamate synthase